MNRKSPIQTAIAGFSIFSLSLGGLRVESACACVPDDLTTHCEYVNPGSTNPQPAGETVVLKEVALSSATSTAPAAYVKGLTKK
jgi:hypothetical protein